MNIGEGVKTLRTKSQMSQEELANTVNVSQSMIAQIERGSKTLTIPLGLQISDALGTTLAELLNIAQNY